MKNLLTLFVLFLGLGMANAQNLSFDETVNYINKILEENSDLNINWFAYGSNKGDLADGIIAEKNGKITFYSKFSNSYTRSEDTKTPTGSFNVFIFDKLNEKDTYVELLDKNNKLIGSLYSFPPSYISKMEKALKHLRTLCIKEKDPFED